MYVLNAVGTVHIVSLSLSVLFLTVRETKKRIYKAAAISKYNSTRWIQ